ncbi:MAG TPA: prepilin peptidase [Syntrophorhabdales bacterium]|nr:prepilin peptidase [Syntrophorhabdales bacterium]
MPIFWSVLFFVLGALIGSFLNVCIYRLPRGKSIVTPGSSCTLCGAPIHFYDNIPIISYMVLRGRCRHCKAVISGRYVVVELLTALLYAALFSIYGFSIELPVVLLFASLLIVISFIDLDFRIIPDILSLGGIIAGLVLSLFRSSIPGDPSLQPSISYLSKWPALLPSLVGILLGGGILWVIAELYARARKQEGMGGGDIKLLAMFGAFYGWEGAIFSLVSASFVGSLVGLPLALLNRKGLKYEIPFGPFLCFGALLYVFLSPNHRVLNDLVVGFSQVSEWLVALIGRALRSGG